MQAPGPTQNRFVAPAPTGEVAGESNALGVRLGTLRIPAFDIPLPTVQLPSLVRYRRDAHMLTDQGLAGFQKQPAARMQLNPQEPAAGPGPAGAPSPECCQPKAAPCAIPRGCTSLTQELESELAARSQQVEELSAQVSQLHGLIRQVADGQENREAQASVDDEDLQTINYEKPQQWSTPEEVHRKRQDRELNGLRSEVSDLKDSFTELVDLQRKQLEQMKQLGDAAAQARLQQPAEPVHLGSPRPETAAPAMTPDPFEPGEYQRTPTRSLSPVTQTRNGAQFIDETPETKSVGDGRNLQTRHTPSQEEAVVVRFHRSAPTAVDASQSNSQKKPGFFSKLKKIGRRTQPETESVR